MVRYDSAFSMHIQTAYQRTLPVPLQKLRTVFLAKIEAYRTFVPHCTVMLDSIYARLLYFVGWLSWHIPDVV